MWRNSGGNSHHIYKSNLGAFIDEVGGNIDMNGDGHIGGEKFIFEKGCIEKSKATRKNKYFTVIGITKLFGEPI